MSSVPLEVNATGLIAGEEMNTGEVMLAGGILVTWNSSGHTALPFAQRINALTEN